MGCSNDNYWKLDKIDKIVISLIFVFSTFFSVFTIFSDASESENVSFDVINDVEIDLNGIVKSNFSGSSIGYIELEKGYIYTITPPKNWSLHFYLSNDVPNLGVSCVKLGNIRNDSFEYVCNSFSQYLFLDFQWSNPNILISRRPIPGFSGAVDDLVSNVSPSALWKTFNLSIPYILVVVLVAFGIYLITHSIREISKGRDV